MSDYRTLKEIEQESKDIQKWKEEEEEKAFFDILYEYDIENLMNF